MRSAKSVGMVWAMHDDSSDADWPAICGLADGVMFDFPRRACRIAQEPASCGDICIWGFPLIQEDPKYVL